MPKIRWVKCEKCNETIDLKTINDNDVPYKVVKEQIIEYLQNTPGEIFVSDIIRKLKFDLMTILKALKELHEEGIIEKLD